MAAGKRIVDGQKKFETLLIINPYEAEKLAAEITKLYAEESFLRDEIHKKVSAFGAVFKPAAKKA